ncbi:hypothetical protein BDV27DRAFT_161569 [Aspergillus caelatus]|uniref:DUF7492 domain-containing protein n=2 Tax=Aspergillus subgen. Circumdati TaxID=2720871 RepID=A0A5N6ZTE8_9EURO|nr:uncharacterized protein BDV27DRAFT_161569 [Aspergillus caelatus]KAE8360533.1 hypothetical protein BDV27DRAFT_161569 [Aspergillus caelatus]KAE8414755.1 hypothetical protein BDV36DRAFT_311640 [Aspergillus pseudocaelatus]
MDFKLTPWKSGLGLLSLLILTPMVVAHSWVEQLMVIAPNGTFVGSPGYSRGNVLRSDPGYSDTKMQYLVPDGRNEILPTDLLCKDTQQQQVQSEGSPRLQASAGAAIALRYQENGHVTLPGNQLGKPENRGTVYVYGTTEPKENEKIMDVHKIWNKEGTGGDKRGVLLATRNFDDGRCYQVNGDSISKQRQSEFPHTADQLMGDNLWCQSDIALPSNAPSGKPYTLYWVWDWPTLPGVDPNLPKGKQEIYTTCIDVDVVANTGAQSHVVASYVQDQSLNNAAIPAQLADIFGSGASSGSAQSSPIDGISRTPSGPRPTASKSSQAVIRSSSSWSSPIVVATPTSLVQDPMGPQRIATVTSFVTMMKTVFPRCSASASPQ